MHARNSTDVALVRVGDCQLEHSLDPVRMSPPTLRPFKPKLTNGKCNYTLRKGEPLLGLWLGKRSGCRRGSDFFGPRRQFQLQLVKEAARLEFSRAVFHVHDTRPDL